MGGKTLLLIGYNHILMDVSKRILERAGYSVFCAVGIEDARKSLTDRSPDGIILAKELPDGNGLDYLSVLVDLCDIPVLFLSDSKEDEVTAFHIGANEFLAQPYSYEVLETRIRLMIDKSDRSHKKKRPEEPAESSSEHEAAVKLSEKHQEAKSEIASTENEPLFITKKPRFRFFTDFATACVVILVAVAGLIAFMDRFPQRSVTIIDEQAPLAEMPFQEGVLAGEYEDFAKDLIVPSLDKVKLRSGSTDLDIMLFNSEDNSCYLVFEIVLRDSGEVLFTSKMTAPGEAIEGIKISKSLALGEHSALLNIHTYLSEDGSSADCISSIKIGRASCRERV